MLRLSVPYQGCAGMFARSLSIATLLVAPALAWGQDLPDPSARTPADPAVESAIARGLAYLKTTQKPDGAWEASFGKATSVTSLAVMAYLSSGHMPGQPGPYREAVEKGIRFVVQSQKPNGLLVAATSHGPMYCHGISTLMLAEVAGMLPDEPLATEVRAALSKAIALILAAQDVRKDSHNAGGWRYQPGSRDSDLSVSGWQVMALRAAKSVGCVVPAENIDRAVDYLKRCAVRGGGFSYQPGGGANNPRTGVGILALELCGAHHTPEALAGADYLARRPPRWGSEYFFYEVYYVPQALFQIGDAAFRAYQSRLLPLLLQHQDANGSWLSDDGNDRSGGRDYCTAMAVLAMTVEFRFLPIYQR
jgi:hypothetical protein